MGRDRSPILKREQLSRELTGCKDLSQRRFRINVKNRKGLTGTGEEGRVNSAAASVPKGRRCSTDAYVRRV